MPTVALTDFASQQAEIERRRRMAEMLQQQANAPIEIQSYKGIQAPIPWTATLGKVLSQLAAAKMQRDAGKEEQQNRQTAREEANKFLGGLSRDPGFTSSEDAMSGIQLDKPGIIDRLKGAMAPPAPAPAMTPPARPPASPQALGAALAGQPPAPPAPPPQSIQQAPLPPAAPPSQPMAPQPVPEPQQALPPMQSLPEPQEVIPQRQAPPQTDFSRPRSMDEQQQMLMSASMSGNPYLEKLAPALYARNQERADKVEDRGYAAQVAALERQGKFEDALMLARMKPEERTAAQKDYEFATQNGYRGDFMSFVRETKIPPFISASAGQNIYSTQGLGNNAPAISPDALLGTIKQAFPGAQITSAVRTPTENAAATGVPNSAHLTGHAVDFVLGSEAEMQAAADRINGQGLPGVRALYEGPGAKNSTGPHVHVQVAQGGGGGSPQPLLRGEPKQVYRPATAAEKAQYGIGADVPAQIGPEGQVQVISGTGAANKRVPAPVQSGYADNRKAIGQIDTAITAIKSNRGAFGLKNNLGDEFNQRIDPNGVGPRAAVANIGSLLIHDRSGAAVTASEQPRLQPFVPRVTDTPEAAIKKLQLLKEQYVAANAEIDTVFGEEAGYTPMGGAPKPAQAGAVAPRKPGETVSQYLARTGG